MLSKGEHIEGAPPELERLLTKDMQAKAFFNTLSKSYNKNIVIG
jgi:hypothetical protein